MGEQSAKSMRGDKMPDVIFAGTSTRKPMNFAEVTLSLTDVEGTLPIEFDEVTITRRLHRSGESEYLLNRSPVRLRDIQGLFLDSGIGRNSFAIFEQGKIDQVINLGPMERRYIFEEAAGILRFLQNKKKGLQRLELTNTNMSRLNDIYGEVEKQMKRLEEQAAAATLYKQNQGDIARLEKAALLAKWEMLQGGALRLQEDCALFEEKRGQLRQGIENVENQLLMGAEGLEKSEEELRRKSEELYQVRSVQEVKRRERLSHEERMREAEITRKRLIQELEEVRVRRKMSSEHDAANRKHRQVLEEEAAAAEKQFKTVQRGCDGLEIRVGELREQQLKLQRGRLQAVQEESRIHTEVQQNTLRLESAFEKRQQIEHDIGQAGSRQRELADKADLRGKELQAAHASVEKQKAILSSFQEQKKEMEAAVAVREKELEAAVRAFTELSARYKALQRLHKEMEGFSEATKRLLSESGNSSGEIAGMVRGLFELIHPKKGYEASLATIMRPYGQTLVVKTEESLRAVLQFAQKEKLEDFSLLCLEHLDKKKGKAQKVDAPPFSRFVVSPELGEHFWERVYLVKTTEEGLLLSKAFPEIACLTEEGSYIDERQVLSLSSGSEGNAFVREAELKTLEERMAEQEAVCQKLSDGIEGLREKRAYIESELSGSDILVRRGEMKVVESNFAFQQAKTELQQVEKRQGTLQEEKKGLDGLCLDLEGKLKELKTAHQAAQKIAAESQEKQATIEAELETLTDQLKGVRQDLQQKQAHYQRASEEFQKLEHLLELFCVKDAEEEKHEKRILQEMDSLDQLRNVVTVKDVDAEKALEQVERQLELAALHCQEADMRVKDWKAQIKSLEVQKNGLLEQGRKLEENLHHVGVKIAQAESSIASTERDLDDKYHLSVDELKQHGAALEMPLEQADKEIRRLKRELEKAGDVNLASIEEFESHQVRYGFLKQQLGDLNTSREEILQIIAELDKESRRLFKSTFDQIKTNFKKNFGILFNGGEADLTFTETDDILEAGIDIVAKPPGKQMRSISLLSGGEKCLTAMALLFAIFEVKSAPFCILDEIDAPLDDSNIDRFVRMVKQFVDRCQFIVITHNKRTMAIADRIFGVSMQERGVSKLLSMKFSAREEEEEPVAVAHV